MISNVCFSWSMMNPEEITGFQEQVNFDVIQNNKRNEYKSIIIVGIIYIVVVKSEFSMELQFCSIKVV